MLPRRRSDEELTIIEWIARNMRHARAYYAAAETSGELQAITYAMRSVKRLYGRPLASDFGPVAVKAVRQAMIGTGWARSNINRQTLRVR